MKTAGDAEGLSALIVEDDPYTRLSLDVIFRRAGFKTEMVSSADEFLRRFETSEDAQTMLADVLITDVIMPGTSGERLIHRLDDCGRFLPVVVVTGHSSAALEVWLEKRGAARLVRKPFRPELLIDAVMQSYREWRAQRCSKQERESTKERGGICQ